MVDYSPRRSRLIFQVDLFPAHGSVPDTLDEANEREKDVRYSSRTRLTTDMLREKHDVRHAINELHELLPSEIANTERAKRLYEYGCVTEMDIAQLIYRPMEPQGALKDFQFGRSTMEMRWEQGLSDARTTLHASSWLAPMPKEIGVRVFDVMHEILVGTLWTTLPITVEAVKLSALLRCQLLERSNQEWVFCGEYLLLDGADITTGMNLVRFEGQSGHRRHPTITGIHFRFEDGDGFFQSRELPLRRAALIGIFFAIVRRNKRWILVEIRSPDPEIFFVRVDPLPQDFTPRASLRGRLALHAHEIGRKTMAIAAAAAPAMV